MTLHVIQHGGVVLFLLVIVAAAIFVLLIEKLFFFHRQYVNCDEFLSGIRTVLKRGNIAEALSICDATPGPVARLVKAAIMDRTRSVDQLRNLLYAASLSETIRLEEKLFFLATLIKIAPLLGFWGVILGLMDIFEVFLATDAPALADQLVVGMWKALVCSGFGLAIFIPGRLGYEYLIQRLRRFIVELEKCIIEILTILKE